MQVKVCVCLCVCMWVGDTLGELPGGLTPGHAVFIWPDKLQECIRAQNSGEFTARSCYLASLCEKVSTIQLAAAYGLFGENDTIYQL